MPNIALSRCVHLALSLAIPLLQACSDGGEDKGGECQSCRSEAPQCDAGMQCARFQSNLTTYRLCAKPTTDKCSVYEPF